jgi:superfamily II RNA helicase
LFDIFRVEDMIKRSFAEIDTTRHISDNQQAQYSLKESIQSLQEEDCPICVQDINQYYRACATVTNFHKNMQVSIKVVIIILRHIRNVRITSGNTAKQSSSSQGSVPWTSSGDSHK